MRDTLSQFEPNREAIRTNAEDAAASHLRAAIAAIDAAFGPGHAAANPALVASLVQAAAIETAVEAGREAHRSTLDTITRLSRETNETLLKLKPRLF
ncbi:MAG: hypothetical protein ACFBRM_07795 [Pikeienuella sp.]